MNNQTLNHKGLYALFAVLAPVAGASAGVLGSLLLGISHLANKNDLTPHELTNAMNYGWVADFTSQSARAALIEHFIWAVAGSVLVFLAALFMLSMMTGRMDRNNDGTIQLNWFDRLWSEVHLTVMVIAAGVAVALAMVAEVLPMVSNWFRAYTVLVPNNYYYGISNPTALILITLGTAALIEIAILCWVSLIKKIKAKELLNKSILGKTMIGLWHGIQAGWKALSSAFRGTAVPGDTDPKASIKLMVKYALLAVFLLLLPWFCGFFFNSGFMAGIGMIVSIATALYVIVRKVGKLAEIRAGVIEVKSGNLTHRITVNVDENGPKTDLDKLASDINHISEATNAAVQNEIKNQRLKTDLISNVSHDLKTPLTSMISYLDILSKEGLDSPDAPKHLAIVQEKTERLRTLTEELFEAAKASSGNIPCEITDIDLNALIDQSLAEMEDRLSKKKLKIKKNIKTENAMVRADGKLLYRVLENLLSNISKYALEKSRVYIDVKDTFQGSDQILLEIKNISKEELNISAEELMERFTRGDSARNTEGSGLGLAIAKDLTTLMGGVFEITIDGDMFKASILLDRA